MASAINSDNGVVSGSAGLKSSADSSGVLDLQTNGTTAISISASQVVTYTNQPTYTGGTANGVMYLNGSKAVTTGTALTFDGAILGVNGISVGRGAGAVATNTALGASALAANTTGASNTAVGQNTLLANTDGTQNTAVGRAALTANTSGVLNSGVGRSCLVTNTTGSYNTAIGGSALALNTTASNNTAVGYQAGYSNTTGTRNVFVGGGAGYAATAADGDTHIGFSAGNSQTTGFANTLVGGRGSASANSGAGNSITTGTYNTFIGGSAGGAVTTGSKNTVLGNYNGNQGGLNILTASNYIVLSDGDGNPRFYANSTAGYGSNAPQAWLEASLLWGTSGSAPHVSGGKAISNDNSGTVTVRAEIRTEVYEWQSGYAFVRASSINADASGGACAWWILGYRAFNGGIAFFGLADSGGNTGTLTLTASDATSGTTSKALAQLRVTGGNNRTVMDVELIAYNEVLTITRS